MDVRLGRLNVVVSSNLRSDGPHTGEGQAVLKLKDRSARCSGLHHALNVDAGDCGKPQKPLCLRLRLPSRLNGLDLGTARILVLDDDAVSRGVQRSGAG